MGGDRRARRQARAREFGARHPRLAFALIAPLLAGVVALCGYQLSHGLYLGRGWVIAGLAGVAAAAGLNAAVVISSRRHSPAEDRFLMAWLVLGLASASAIRFPFPLGPYGSVQAFFNVVHAALLGYEAVTVTAILALLVYAVLRSRSAAASREVQAGQAADLTRLRLPARLKFAGVAAATWRAGNLIAADGAVTWRSLKGDAEVDLTAACQALPMRPAGTRGRGPRTTALVTASGLVEVDVSPKALTALARTADLPSPLSADTSTRPGP